MRTDGGQDPVLLEDLRLTFSGRSSLSMIPCTKRRYTGSSSFSSSVMNTRFAYSFTPGGSRSGTGRTAPARDEEQRGVLDGALHGTWIQWRGFSSSWLRVL